MPLVKKHRGRGRGQHHSDEEESTPICRCRVLYLGSAVPHITKDGLQGIQEPLKELYPDTGLSSLKGIDSWLSVWSNGLLLENVDEKNTKITRFFPIESLHYCAAVRNVFVPASSTGSSSGEKVQKFLPLDSPFARLPNLNQPPLFACILRRTTGIKVLECHAFICKREMAANALVRCCFHAYADSTYAKQLENGGTLQMTNGNSTSTPNGHTTNGSATLFKDNERSIQRSVTPLDSIEKVAGWQAFSQNGDSDIIVVGNSTDEDLNDGPMTSTPRNNKFEFSAEFPDEDEIYEGDENHKIWGGANTSTLGHNGTSSSELVYLEPDGTLKSVKSQGSKISRPRQFISPPPPPPPPPQYSLLKSAEDDVSSSSTKKKTKKKLKNKDGKSSSQGKYLVRPASMMNLSTGHPQMPGPSGVSPSRSGSVINGPVTHRPSSAMSTLTKSRPMHSMHPHMPPPHLIPLPHGAAAAAYPVMAGMPPQPMYGPLPPPHFALAPTTVHKGKGSKSKKKQHQILTHVPMMAPAPLHIVPPSAAHSYPNPMTATPPPMHLSGKNPHNGHGHGHDDERKNGLKHSPEMLGVPSHYATIERGYHYHSAPSSKHNNSSNNASYNMVNGHSQISSSQASHHQMNGDSTLTSTKSRSKNGTKSSSKNPNSSSNNRDGSPFNTGIYRKKGHLNERAFSYSIRQEHRSRSHGSLANLQFSNDAEGSLLRPSGSPPHTSEGMKKEREIIQMVRDLDLSGDEIERSQVPVEMYPPRHANGYRLQNGHGQHGPRITHR